MEDVCFCSFMLLSNTCARVELTVSINGLTRFLLICGPERHWSHVRLPLQQTFDSYIGAPVNGMIVSKRVVACRTRGGGITCTSLPSHNLGKFVSALKRSAQFLKASDCSKAKTSSDTGLQGAFGPSSCFCVTHLLQIFLLNIDNSKWRIIGPRLRNRRTLCLEEHLIFVVERFI